LSSANSRAFSIKLLPFAVAAALAGVFQSGTGEIAEKIAVAVCSAVRAVLYRPPRSFTSL
jgi:hypothetical protein